MNRRHHGARTSVHVAAHALEGVAVGLSAGLVVGGFRRAHDAVFTQLPVWFGEAREHWWIVPLWFAVLVVVAWILGRLTRAVPLIPGSGIPQIELSLAGRLPVPPAVWPRVLAAKFAGSWLSVTAGLSLGREGPSIQMGGALGVLIGRLRGETRLRNNPALVAGAAAGLAAAFGAPAAGMLFAFEEMKSRRSAVNIVTALAAAFAAQMVCVHGFGLGKLFPFADFRPPILTEAWTLLPLGVLLGGLGVAYNKGLLSLKDAEAAHSPLPRGWRTLPPLLAAGALAFMYPQVLGGGDGLIVALGRNSHTVTALVWLFLIKAGFSLFSYTGGTPGGLLMPMLCQGALLGDLAGRILTAAGLVSTDTAAGFILFGMAGYFAAAVRAPLTGLFLVIEMSGADLCLPGALAVALIANTTANRLRCPPIYDSLKERIKTPKP